MARSGRHLVLQFPAKQQLDKTPLIRRLADALPEFSVFDSGGNQGTDWVTVMPVVERATVLAHAPQIQQAVEAYIRACSTMLGEHAEGTLSAEWSSYTHGGHRRFENSETGQVIEAPLGGAPEPEKVDPFFFTLFTKSTPGLETVAGLLSHDFHDAARMLDILFRKAKSAQLGASPNGGPAEPPGSSGVGDGPPSVS
jgi:hypothetical protein